ncbi:MAG: ATP-binding cassette domain-containing protein [Ruminococcus sp.]|nr:ATP-binding cassette domain-containing protein [Ruminococcus sp.]
MKEVIVKTNQLTKKYDDFVALDNINMTVNKGDIYGLIGRNGAGKTTIMKIITGLTESSGGDYELFSKPSNKLGDEKGRIGCLIENPAFFNNLSAYNNLKYYAIQKGISDMSKIGEVLEMVKLKNVKDKKFRTFSLGMKQRLGIAFALMDDPDLVILDEPINGIDPIGISELRDTFTRLTRERGITFIISSHILSELYLMANRFMFIDKGKVLKEITHEELDAECMRCTVFRTNNVKKATALIEERLNIHDYKVIDNTEIRIYSDDIAPAVINTELVKNGISVSALFESGITLEEYFKSLVGGSTND